MTDDDTALLVVAQRAAAHIWRIRNGYDADDDDGILSLLGEALDELPPELKKAVGHDR